MAQKHEFFRMIGKVVRYFCGRDVVSSPFLVSPRVLRATRE